MAETNAAQESWWSERRGEVVPRRDERHRTAGLRCPLGDVVDLSASGMRVRTRTRPPLGSETVETLVIESDRQRLRIPAEAVWFRRIAEGGEEWFEVGFRFHDQRGPIREALDTLARDGFVDPAGIGGATPGAPVRASMEVEDLYAILGVERGASAQEIREAHAELSRVLGSDPSGRLRDTLDKAYRVLREPALRSRYDAMLDAAAA